jgi:hypothetical protein
MISCVTASHFAAKAGRQRTCTVTQTPKPCVTVRHYVTGLASRRNGWIVDLLRAAEPSPFEVERTEFAMATNPIYPSQVPTLSPRKQQGLGSLPALIAMLSTNIAEKKNLLHYYIVMLTQNIKKKRTKDPICSFLKNLISPYGFGWEENHGVGR